MEMNTLLWIKHPADNFTLNMQHQRIFLTCNQPHHYINFEQQN